MKKHLKNLFSNLPVRHKFVHLEDDTNNITDTLDNLIRMEKIMHFFILAK